ncbi:hypothetical protein MRX96_057932 [Rhipicephalus microplus]
MHADEVDKLVSCSKKYADMPDKVLRHWNDHMALFAGMSDVDVFFLSVRLRSTQERHWAVRDVPYVWLRV